MRPRTWRSCRCSFEVRALSHDAVPFLLPCLGCGATTTITKHLQCELEWRRHRTRRRIARDTISVVKVHFDVLGATSKHAELVVKLELLLGRGAPVTKVPNRERNDRQWKEDMLTLCERGGVSWKELGSQRSHARADAHHTKHGVASAIASRAPPIRLGCLGAFGVHLACARIAPLRYSRVVGVRFGPAGEAPGHAGLGWCCRTTAARRGGARVWWRVWLLIPFIGGVCIHARLCQVQLLIVRATRGG